VSLAVVLLGLLSVTTLASILMAPRIMAQASELQEQLPQAWARLQEMLRRIPYAENLLSRIGAEEIFQSDAVRSSIPQVFSVTLSGVVQFFLVN
jgi:predicted PurR-regulated permease PerM